MSREGKCTEGEDFQFLPTYPLFNAIKCPLSQKSYTFHRLKFEDVLKNNGYYDTYIKYYDLFKLTIDLNHEWGLDSETAFHKNTLHCILNHYDKIKDQFVEIDITIDLDTQIKTKYKNILKMFINLDTTFQKVNIIQIYMLVSNCFIVMTELIIILIKLSITFAKIEEKLKVRKCIIVEKYLIYFADIANAVVGYYAFHELTGFNNILTAIFESGCLDDYVRYVLSNYSAALGNTADENIQIFIIVVLKIFIQFISIIFQAHADKCKVAEDSCCRLFMESFSFDDDSEEEQEDDDKAKEEMEALKEGEGESDGKNKDKVHEDNQLEMQTVKNEKNENSKI